MVRSHKHSQSDPVTPTALKRLATERFWTQQVLAFASRLINPAARRKQDCERECGVQSCPNQLSNVHETFVGRVSESVVRPLYVFACVCVHDTRSACCSFNCYRFAHARVEHYGTHYLFGLVPGDYYIRNSLCVPPNDNIRFGGIALCTIVRRQGWPKPAKSSLGYK